MKIEIGSAIAGLRRAKGITQEQLAAAIGVSAPAVSKWETGQCYPDITLLAPLARFLCVTVDTLLSYEQALSDEKRDALTVQVSTAFANEGWTAGMSLCESLLREYPRDAMFRLALCRTVSLNAVYAENDEQRMQRHSLGEKWLKEALSFAEGETLLAVKHMLGVIHLYQNRPDDAETVFSDLIGVNLKISQLMPTVRIQQERFDEAETLCQQNLLESSSDAISALATLTTLAVKQQNVPLAISYADAADALASSIGIGQWYVSIIKQAQISAVRASKDIKALLAATIAYADSICVLDVPLENPPLLHRLPARQAPQTKGQNQALRAVLANEFETGEQYTELRNDPEFIACIHRIKNSKAPI